MYQLFTLGKGCRNIWNGYKEGNLETYTSRTLGKGCRNIWNRYRGGNLETYISGTLGNNNVVGSVRIIIE